MKELFKIENCVDDEVIKIVGQFSIMWGLFEWMYLNNNASMCAIKKVYLTGFGFEEIAEAFRTEMVNFIHGRYGNKEINTKEVETVLFSDVAHADGLDEITEYLRYENDDFKNCIRCLFRIRTNMFHGLKQIEELNKQRAIFQTAIAVLTEMIKR